MTPHTSSAGEAGPRARDLVRSENAELTRRLEEAEDTIRAIHMGAVDAFVMKEVDGHRVYTIEGVDRPYRLFVERMEEGAATLGADGTITYCNRRLAEMLKTSPESLVGEPLHRFMAEEDRAIYDNLVWQGRTHVGRAEARLRRDDGALAPAFFTFSALPKDCGAAIAVLVTDLTVQKHHEELTAAHKALRESQSQLARQKEALEVALSAAPFDAILEVIASSAQQLAGGDARAAITIVDAERNCLRFGAAAGMPEDYPDFVSGHCIGPDHASCSTAAFSGETVIVADVERDPKWAPLLEFARAHQLRACWSCPIIGAEGRALGTIAIYHRTPRAPAPGELEPIEQLADSAAVILERHRESAQRQDGASDGQL